MSLDVYLTIPGYTPVPRQAVFVRERGATRAIPLAEWAQRFPGRTPLLSWVEAPDEAWHGNLTHNLAPMARACGLYVCCWEPETHGIATAAQLQAPLQQGLARLRRERAALVLLQPVNGWGTYDDLVAFVEEYLRACEQWPEASVRVER